MAGLTQGAMAIELGMARETLVKKENNPDSFTKAERIALAEVLRKYGVNFKPDEIGL